MMMKQVPAGRWSLVALFALSSMLQVTNALDFNGDGMSDVWQRIFGIESTDAESDPDGDGKNNLLESIAGTDPWDNDSYLRAEAVNDENGGVIVEWKSLTGKRYQVEKNTDLTDANGWTALGSVVAGNDEFVSVVDLISGDKAFYRVKVVPSLSSDSDLLDDWEEFMLGTSPTSADTDGDTISDSDEFLGFLNPTSEDTDGDGIPDQVEIAVYFTNPRSADTDGDGVDDRTETGYVPAFAAFSNGVMQMQQGGTNPLDPTDGFPTAEQRQVKVRMLFRGTWPNYTGTPPTIPPINFSIGSAASITEAAVTTPPVAGQFYFGSTNDATDKPINRGASYPFSLTFAGNLPFWPKVEGRVWGSPINPPADRANLLISAGGNYFLSNDGGGVWSEGAWSATGNGSIATVTERQLIGRSVETGTLWAVTFDLDIDSDGNNGFAVPSRSLVEEDVEETQAKVVLINVNDDDGDNVPDFQDLSVAQEQDLVPLVLEVGPGDLEWDRVKVKFRYSGNPNYNSGRVGDMRLWKANSSRITRTAADYIEPNRIYTAAELGLGTNTTQLKFFVEGLNGMATSSLVEAVFIFNDKEYFHDAVAVQVQGEKIDFKEHNPLNTVLYVPNNTQVNQQGRVTIAADVEITANPNFNVGTITSTRGTPDTLRPNTGSTNPQGTLKTVLATTTLSTDPGSTAVRTQFQGSQAQVQSPDLNVAFPVTYENTFLITAYTTSSENEYAGNPVNNTESRVGGERAYYYINSTVAARPGFLQAVAVEGFGIMADGRVLHVTTSATRAAPANLPTGTNRSWTFFDINIALAPGNPRGSTNVDLVDGVSAAIVRARNGQGVVIPSRSTFTVQGRQEVRRADDRVSARQGNYHIDLYMLQPRAVVHAFRLNNARVDLQSYAP